MALDAYVGTMTRFYRREWENVVERSAHEQGTRYTVIHAGGKPAPPPAAEEIRQAVATWQNELSRQLEPHGVGRIAWNEGDNVPYFTDRPAWEGYRALLVWAAHAEHSHLPMPAELPQTWLDDPAFVRCTAPGSHSRFRTILEAEVWLPVELPFVFKGPSLSSETSKIGSVILRTVVRRKREADNARPCQVL